MTTNHAVPAPAVVEGSGRILQHIRDGRAQTTSDLAALMGMARSTVVQRLELLSAQQLIRSEMINRGGRGRPAAAAVFNPAAAHILAAHVGLTGCRIAVTDLAGVVLAHRFVEVDLAGGPDGLLADLEQTFDQLVTDAGLDRDRLAGIGVAVPRSIELFGYLRSLGLDSADWGRQHFHEVLQRRYSVPVYLDTDVNLLGLAERARSWPEAEVVFCAKLGTIIDASVVVNGVPLRGVSQMAGELAHVKVSGSTALCTCGSVGCLDAVASGAALVRQLRESGADVQHVSDVVRMANEGSPEAVRAVRDAGRSIGEALSAVVNLLNPDAITVWGYLAEAETVLFSGIRESLYKAALPESSKPLTLVAAALGELAGVLGAASLVATEVLRPSYLDRALASGNWTGRAGVAID